MIWMIFKSKGPGKATHVEGMDADRTLTCYLITE